MKRYLCLALVLCLGLGVVGCTAEQKKSFEQARIKFMEQIDDGKEKTDEALKVAGEALAKLDTILDRAESDVPVTVPSGDPVVDMIGTGAKAAQPFVPYPFNYLLLLAAPLAGWLRANTKKKKREAEEGLLVMALQRLKNDNPEAFSDFLKYRDMAAKGLLSAKEFAELLEGINSVRLKYSA